MPEDDPMLATIFDRFPSKRKLIRDTKRIKVTFGQFESKLLFPRMDINHKVHENEGGLDLFSIENEFYEQTHRLKLLNQVQSSGLLTGAMTTDREFPDLGSSS